MEIWKQASPPATYDKGMHNEYCRIMDTVDYEILPKYVIGEQHLANCRMMHLGLISDGQAMPPIKYSDGTITPFIPGSGNALLIGPPGIGKTMICLVYSGVYGLLFKRIQFTSDMLPADIIGSRFFNQETGKFEINWGPAVVGHYILADETNRATPKTQSALLERQESWSTTIWDQVNRIDPEGQMFYVVGTANPVESGGTFPLGEAFADRFGFCLYFKPLEKDEEMKKLLYITDVYADPQNAITPVMTERELVAMRTFRRMNVQLPDETADYIVRVVKAFRTPEREPMLLDGLPGYSPEKYGRVIQRLGPERKKKENMTEKEIRRVLLVGPSDRAMEAFFGNLTRAHAFRRGAWRAETEDAKAVAVDCLNHRLVFTRSGNSLYKQHHAETLFFVQFQRLVVETALRNIANIPRK